MAGKPASPELIDAVRRCAAGKMSMEDAAAKLTTAAHRLTRDAISGIARRNRIEFNADMTASRNARPSKRKAEPLRLPVPPELPYVEVSRRRGSYRFYGLGIWRYRSRRGWALVSGALVPRDVLRTVAEQIAQ